jgi:hypothetical protein
VTATGVAGGVTDAALAPPPDDPPDGCGEGVEADEDEVEPELSFEVVSAERSCLLPWPCPWPPASAAVAVASGDVGAVSSGCREVLASLLAGAAACGPPPWPAQDGFLPLAPVAGSAREIDAIRARAARANDLRRALGGVRPM